MQIIFCLRKCSWDTAAAAGGGQAPELWHVLLPSARQSWAHAMPGKRKAKGMQGVVSFKERIVGWWSWARSVSMPGEPVANARLIPKLRKCKSRSGTCPSVVSSPPWLLGTEQPEHHCCLGGWAEPASPSAPILSLHRASDCHYCGPQGLLALQLQLRHFSKTSNNLRKRLGFLFAKEPRACCSS